MPEDQQQPVGKLLFMNDSLIHLITTAAGQAGGSQWLRIYVQWLAQAPLPGRRWCGPRARFGRGRGC